MNKIPVNYFLSAEAVARGHPDKVADQISDALVDAYLTKDPEALVAVETLITKETCMIAGETNSCVRIDLEKVARQTLEQIGYHADHFSFHILVHEQSPEIYHLVSPKTRRGAGDQAVIVGYATSETEEHIPWPHLIARQLIAQIESSQLPFLGLDGKSLVIVEYLPDQTPLRIDTILISFQHHKEVELSHVRQAISSKLHHPFIDEKTHILINPMGSFTQGGPEVDTGLTGRKQVIDAYGPQVPIGGGCFSGKDPSKVDRSGAYYARWVAKNILVKECLDVVKVHLQYGIGLSSPLGILVETDRGIYPFAPLPFGEVVDRLMLQRPIYYQTSYGGHFGRPGFPWEQLNLFT